MTTRVKVIELTKEERDALIHCVSYAIEYMSQEDWIDEKTYAAAHNAALKLTSKRGKRK